MSRTKADMEAMLAFVRAQVDLDEQLAQAAASGGRWRYEDGDSVGAWTLYDEHWRIADLATYRHDDYDYSNRMPAARNPRYVDADANGAHIARQDPARQLREVDAKQKMLDQFDHYTDCWLLELMALPYVDRPGFREEWKP